MNPVDEGTPEDGSLSPLLSNIVLDEFDRELERRGLRFARYASDSNIYVRSRRARERVMESLTRFIMSKLKLQVNQQKSAVARPWARKFLGFSFTSAGTLKRRIAPKAVDRFKERIRELTSRNRGVSIERMAEELSRYLGGWSVISASVKRHRCWPVLSSGSGADSGLRSGNSGSVPGAVRRVTPSGCERRPGRSNGAKRSWSLAAGGLAHAQHRIAQCLLRLARDSAIDRETHRLTRQTAGCGPACPWCGRGGAVRLLSYPDSMYFDAQRARIPGLGGHLPRLGLNLSPVSKCGWRQSALTSISKPCFT